MEATTQNQLADLRAMLAVAEQRLTNARPVDVAGGSTTTRRDSAQRKVDRLRAAIARLELDAARQTEAAAEYGRLARSV